MLYKLSLIILGISIFTACQQVSTQNLNNLAKNAKATPSNTTAHDDEASAKRITLKDAKAAYDAGTAVIVDTRSIDAYNNDRIKDSISMPVGEIEKRYGELPKDKQIIFYCS